MGSRAVLVVAKSVEAARKRFGVSDGKQDVVFTRTGRSFFNDDSLQGELVSRVERAIDSAGWWERHKSDWFVLDAELMPWSLKAVELLRTQ